MTALARVKIFLGPLVMLVTCSLAVGQDSRPPVSPEVTRQLQEQIDKRLETHKNTPKRRYVGMRSAGWFQPYVDTALKKILDAGNAHYPQAAPFEQIPDYQKQGVDILTIRATFEYRRASDAATTMLSLKP